MEAVYPNTEELIPDFLLSQIPSSMIDSIIERYKRLGPAYATLKKHTDGRPINNCMFTSDTENAIEEVIDGQFRILTRMFKERLASVTIQDDTWKAFKLFVELYTLLKRMNDIEMTPIHPWGEVAPR